MKLLQNWTLLRWMSIGILVGCFIILMFFAELAIAVIIGEIVVGAIEKWLAHNKQQLITHWYIPLLPKSIDMPIAIAVPIGLVIKGAIMWSRHELITIWFFAATIVLTWIVSHLCSLERK